MLHRTRTPLRLTVIAAVAFLASLSITAQPVPGTYDLNFLNSDLESVSTLSVCTASERETLTLNAHIETSSGPAQGGAVVFQYCSFKGLPPFDITRADEAPSAACEDGSATWANLAVEPVSESGDAYWDFGCVIIPRTVGFRYKFLGKGTGIRRGVGGPADFTWVPAP
jgi:hypothetical protein